MQAFIRNIFTLDDIQCGLAAALLFMLPLRKRRGFLWRFLLSASAALLIAGFLALLHNSFLSYIRELVIRAPSPELYIVLLHVIVPAFLQILVLTAVFWFCCNLPLPQLLYGAVCALISETLAYLCFLLFFPQGGYRIADRNHVGDSWIELLILVAVYALIYLAVAVRLPRDREYRYRSGPHAIVLFWLLILVRFIGGYVSVHYSNTNPGFVQIILIASVTMLSLLLFGQLLISLLHEWREEAKVEAQLRDIQKQEYRQFRHSAFVIRHAVHELKHILAALPFEEQELHKGFVKELEDALTVYEAHMDTGNDMLDALLAVAWKRCRENDVKWTCLADGSALHSVTPVDLYVLLGNALDNAIESAVRTEDTEKRFLSLNIWKNVGCAFIKLENNCQTPPAFADGLPVTTKTESDSHGYGTRSIRDIAERLGGHVNMSVHDEVFTLDIVLPLGEDETQTKDDLSSNR